MYLLIGLFAYLFIHSVSLLVSELVSQGNNKNI